MLCWWQCTGYWFHVRLRLGSLKIATEFHIYAMYKNHIYSQKCSLVDNTHIKWVEIGQLNHSDNCAGMCVFYSFRHTACDI